MNHKKLKELSKITTAVVCSIDGLLKAQYFLVEFMCQECNIPRDMIDAMIDDMNKTIGIKKI